MNRTTPRADHFIALIPLLGAFAAPAMAIQVTDNLDLGGAVRARWDYDPDRDIQKFNFDTWIAAAKYRFYGRAYPYQYTNNVGDVSFAESAWVGYKFNEN